MYLDYPKKSAGELYYPARLKGKAFHPHMHLIK
jgi:hypothetical protein